MQQITLSPEYVGTAFGVPITNTFLTSILVTLLIACTLPLFRRHARGKTTSLAKIVTYELLALVDSVTRDRALSKRVMPLILTFFVFILTANLLALIPGFLGSLFVSTPTGPVPLLRSPNSDLTTTLALALVSMCMVQVFSLRALGVRQYLARFIKLTGVVDFVLGFFELLSETVKVLSFSFRLFGNIFAGEVLLLVVAFIVPLILPVPFMVLEVFVGIIQAFIFSMLTVTFIKAGTLREHSPQAPITQ